MDGTGNAWTGAMTDIMHNVWMCYIDNSQTGTMTDVLYDVWTDGMAMHRWVQQQMYHMMYGQMVILPVEKLQFSSCMISSL